MKKVFKLSAVALVAVVLGLIMTTGSGVSAKKEVSKGTLIKGKSIQTVYYLGEDGKRYVFPNAKTYFSWYDDFNAVTEIEDKDLYDMPLGGNVTYKPGVYLVKIQTDPKVYAVAADGKLRWIKTEAVAKRLYGDNWNKLIDDVPDSFFVNYEVGNAIEVDDDFDPEVEEDETKSINENLGLKARKKIAKKELKMQEKRCQWLDESIKKIQKRAKQWGIEVKNIGDDYLGECVSEGNDKKVKVCHVSKDNGTYKTLEIGKPAAKAHLAHGDTMGECVIEDDDSDDDDSDDSNSTGTDDSLDDDGDDDDDSATSTDDSLDDDSDDSTGTSTNSTASSTSSN